MAHNPTIALTETDVLRARTARPLLVAKVGETANIDFIKRDGTVSALSGTVVEVTGKDDKEIVKVSTDKGFRSANVWNVLKVS